MGEGGGNGGEGVLDGLLSLPVGRLSFPQSLLRVFLMKSCFPAFGGVEPFL